MSGASTFTKAERFAVALADARQVFDLVSEDCKYFMGCAKELEAENAKLCQQLADVTESMGRVEERCAKLRELVRDMNECLEHCKLVCEYCKFQGVDCQWFKFIERMRELGVEE